MTSREKHDGQVDTPPPLGRRRIGSTATTSLPIYHQLYVVLRQKLKDGYFAPDTLLPAEFSLSSDYGVSRVPVRRTLDLLERDGLIVRKRGIGTFASPPRTRWTPRRLPACSTI